MQVGFDFAVDDKIADFLVHKLVLKAEKVTLSSNFIFFEELLEMVRHTRMMRLMLFTERPRTVILVLR